MRANTISFPPFSETLLPHDPDAEATILGQILLQPELGIKLSHLPVQAYYIRANQLIYQAVLALVKQGRLPDLMTVLGWLDDHEILDQVGGQVALINLVQSTVSTVNYQQICDRLLEKYHRRKLIELGHSLSTKAQDSFSPLDKLCKEATRTFEQWLESTSSKDAAEQKIYEDLIRQIEDIELRVDNPGLRQLKLRHLAKKHGISIADLQSIWIKHLTYKGQEKRITWSELIEDSDDFQRWALHGFAPLGSLILLHAPGGTGKTRLFYDWAYCMAKGEPWSKTPEWTGYLPTKRQRKILIVQTDETRPEMVEALRLRGVDSSLNIQYRTHWSTSLMPQLVRDIEEFQPEVILIDSLSSVNYDSLVSENDVEYARPVLFLRHLASKYECSIFLIHHSNKLGDVRGSSAIQAAASMVMSLERDPKYSDADDGHRLLRIGKSRSRAPKCYSLEGNFENGQWTILGERVGDRDEPDLSLPLKDLIVSYFSARRNIKFTSEELAETLSRNINSLRKALGALARDGIISKIKPLAGGATLYFIEGEREDQSSGSSDLINEGSERIKHGSNMDQSLEPLPVKDSREFSQALDPQIPQSEDFSASMKRRSTPTNTAAVDTSELESQARQGVQLASEPLIQPDPPEIHPDPVVIEENVQGDSTKIGDRILAKDGATGTIVGSCFSFITVRYDSGVRATLGYTDFRPLSPEEDPLVEAEKLFERIQPLAKIKICKYPDHKGYANKVGIALKKQLVNGSYLVKVQVGEETVVANLLACKLVEPKRGDRIQFKNHSGHHYGRLITTTQLGNWVVEWEEIETSYQRPRGLKKTDDFIVVAEQWP